MGEKISTQSPESRLWLNEGVLNSFGLRRAEAIRCFKKALSFDSDCPMAYFFIAHNNAADYNNPNGMDYAEGFKETEKAMELAKSVSGLTDWEKALIEAQTHRFCSPVGSKPMAELHRNYANAMRSVYKRFGEQDPDIATLFAESLMMLAPWKLWTKPPNIKPAIPETEEVVAVLEKGLKIDPNHPGLCHYYIHAMELSATPEKALPEADRLRSMYPTQGHLIHMPSHIDMWVGQYKEAVDVNKVAIISDEEYKSKTTGEVEMYDGYRMHNYHFTVWAAMFDGQYATALEYAELAGKQLGISTVTAMLGQIPLGKTFLESYSTLPWHVLVRFGKWQEIIDRPLKEDHDAYAGNVATSFYARAVAFAVLGRLGEADAERKKFYSAIQNKALEKRFLHNNIMYDQENSSILSVAEAVMNGEVEYHKGNFDEAFKHLYLAVERDIGLTYDEPWGWMTPARHVLGALLLERKEAAKAEDVYREDLKQYKNNLWSLMGLYQALKQQGKSKEAESVYDLFKKASVRADVTIGASCLCATKLCCKK